MKKLLLSLFVSFISLIGFGYCATNCLEPGNSIYNNSEINYSNCGNTPMVVCAYGQAGMFASSQGYSLNLQGFTVCYYVNSNEYVSVSSRGQDYMLFPYYPSTIDPNNLQCNGSTLDITLHNNSNNSTSVIPFILNDGDSLGYDIYYTGNNTPITYDTYEMNIGLSNYLKLCPSDLQYCESELSNCQLTPSNCSSCESDLSTCQGNLSSCGTSLSSCNSDLSACLSGNVGTGEYNWSALFINNIQHLGKPIINVTIPEEIDWDYTGNENSFDLTVKGYAVDSDYIQGIIDINSYQVTSEDFTNIFVNGLTLIFPYIIVVLFIVFIRKLVKKIFS